MNTARFDINNFISKALKENLIDLVMYCEKEYEWASRISYTKTSPYKDMKEEIKKYSAFIHGLLYILNNSSKAAMEDFERNRPIIEALVAKKAIKRECIAHLLGCRFGGWS